MKWIIRWVDGTVSVWPVSFLSLNQVESLRNALDVRLA